MSTFYDIRIQIANISICKVYFKPKLQKDVPANNGHPKVPEFHVEIQHLHWYPPYLRPTAPS